MQDSPRNTDRAEHVVDDSAEVYEPATSNTDVTSDTDILEAGSPGVVSNMAPALRRLEVGATVFSSDGIEVAVVEAVGPSGVGVRAGQPGRPIDLPLSVLADVSPDGRGLDLRLSSEEVERLAGGDQPGYAHLEALRPQDIAEMERETPPGSDVPPASR